MKEFFALLIVLFLVNGAGAQSKFDSTWGNRFQVVLDSVLLANNHKGASLAVLDPEFGLFTAVSGISSPGVPVSSGLRFGLESNSKLFVAVTLAKLQEEGVLSLDDHLYQWIPSYPYVDSTITIRQLLSHQSGLYDYANDFPHYLDSVWADTSRFWTPEELLLFLGPPHFQPGQGYRYSNTNYLIAAMLVSVATDTTWVQNLHDAILDPLDMDSTFVGAYEDRNGPVAAFWVTSPSNMCVTNAPMTSDASSSYGCGGIFSSAQEMTEWYRALFNGDVINDSSLQQVIEFDPTSFYGLGVGEFIYRNHLFYNHTGYAFYTSVVLFDVESGDALCILFNDQFFLMGDFLVPLLDVMILEHPKKPNDAGISDIIAPWGNSCNTPISSVVKLTNFGSDPLLSVEIKYRIDEGTLATYNWNGTLNSGDTTEVSLPGIGAEPGIHKFTCFSTLPNGFPEGFTYNDTAKSTFIINAMPSVISTISESFEGEMFPPPGWAENYSSMYQWGRTPLAGFSGDHSAVRSNIYDDAIGAIYDLDLPMIRIDNGTHPIIDFEYAYRKYGMYTGDSLQVLITTDCGTTWQKLFYKGGQDLQTTSSTVYPFYPRSAADWKHESISLAAFPGDALIRFRNVNGSGNNLYIDDVSVSFPEAIARDNSSPPLPIYPNPTNSDITIETTGEGHLSILNLNGQQLITHPVKETKTILDVSTLPSGVYVVKVVGEKGVEVGKIIKQ